MLDAYDYVDKDKLFAFMKTTHSKYGGFSKLPGDEHPGKLSSYDFVYNEQVYS